MDDIEFLWRCVREGKLSKQSATEILDKWNEIFSDGGCDNVNAAARGGHEYTSLGNQCGKDTVAKATFYSVGSNAKHISGELILTILLHACICAAACQVVLFQFTKTKTHFS